jgi:hypothetical protein
MIPSQKILKNSLIAILALTAGLLPLTGMAQKSQKSPPKEESVEPELPAWDERDPENTGASTLAPPFGRTWGEAPESVRSWSENRGYRRKRYQKDDQTILEVQGPFQNSKFETLRFHYQNNKLTEVELEFPARRTESDGLLQLADIRNNVEKLLGSGTPQKEESEEKGESLWRINRVTWESSPSELWLINFQMKEKSPEGINQTVCITSLHYRANRSGQK